MTASLGSPPPVCNLPLSTGQDLVVDFECQDGNGNSVDYPDGVSVTLIVELWRLGLVSAPAVMTGSHAVCYVSHQTTDQLDDGTIWRCQVTAPGSLGTPPTINLVPVNGTTKRYDGAGADSSTPVSIPVVLGPGGDVTVLVPTPGTPGRDGNPGPANTLAIGTVEGGDTAAATITGSSPGQTLNLVLPAGAPGAKGNAGDRGPTGAAGGVNTVNTRSGDVTLTSSDVGLDSVDNTADVDKPVSTATQSALDAKEVAANKGAANGYAPLGADILIPSAYLPSYVDDVLEFANLAAFPGTGASGKIYTAIDTGKIYRWSGSIYVEISPSPGSTDAVPEGSTNLYYTAARADARVVAGITDKADKATTVSAGTGLTGGGDLSASRTLAVAYGTAAGTAAQGNDSRLSDTRTPTDGSVTLPKLSATGSPSSSNFLRGDNTWATPAGGAGTVRVGTVTSSATPSINTDSYDQFNITAQAVAITSMTSGMSGTPLDGQPLSIRIKDNGVPQSIAWGARWRGVGSILPVVTIPGSTFYIDAVYNAADSIWDVVVVRKQLIAVQIKGSASAAATSVTFPTHQPGDTIVLFPFNNASVTIPGAPAAAGTVPAWNSIASAPGNTCAAALFYFTATASNHTSGTWTNTTGMVVVVLRGSYTLTVPYGGEAVALSSASASQVVSPSVTMSKTDGTSALLYFYGHRTVTAWSAAPTGCTQLTKVDTSVVCNSKTDSTSDGAITQGLTATAVGSMSAVLEIVAAT